MAGDRTKKYQEGFEQGQKSPRGFFESIADGLGEVVPHPSSDEYRSWEKGRDAGEKWRSENPYPKEEKETDSSYGGDGGGGDSDGGSGSSYVSYGTDFDSISSDNNSSSHVDHDHTLNHIPSNNRNIIENGSITRNSKTDHRSSTCKIDHRKDHRH